MVHDDATFLARYLTSCGFFELFDPKDPRAGSDVTGRLTRIQHSRDIPKFAGDVMTMLAIGDEDLESAVKYSVVELLRNVVQHSRSPVNSGLSRHLIDSASDSPRAYAPELRRVCSTSSALSRSRGLSMTRMNLIVPVRSMMKNARFAYR